MGIVINGTVLCAILFSFLKFLVSNLEWNGCISYLRYIIGPIRNGIFSLGLLTLSLVNVGTDHVPTGFLPYNFTLVAVNVTLLNAKLTGIPLILRHGRRGSFQLYFHN